MSMADNLSGLHQKMLSRKDLKRTLQLMKSKKYARSKTFIMALLQNQTLKERLTDIEVTI